MAIDCSDSGKRLTNRLITVETVPEWTVPNTGWPVKDNSTADIMVEESRNSPIMARAGCRRIAASFAFEKSEICLGTSLCTITECLLTIFEYVYSIGCSEVMILP